VAGDGQLSHRSSRPRKSTADSHRGKGLSDRGKKRGLAGKTSLPAAEAEGGGVKEPRKLQVRKRECSTVPTVDSLFVRTGGETALQAKAIWSRGKSTGKVSCPLTNAERQRTGTSRSRAHALKPVVRPEGTKTTCCEKVDRGGGAKKKKGEEKDRLPKNETKSCAQGVQVG